MQAALHIIPTFMWWDIIDFIDISSRIIITICINGLPNNSSWSPNWNNQDEFAGPKELADYLLKLDKDDEAYNQYFKWKVRRLSSTLMLCVELRRPSYWLTWEPLSESLWCWQKTKDIGVIKRTWDCISLWPMLFPGYSYSFSYSWCFQGTGEFINTRFFCRVCALMHNTQVCIHQHHLGQLVQKHLIALRSID